MILTRLYSRLWDLRNAQSNAPTSEKRAEIEREISRVIETIRKIEA
jgi:hypothetical protein